MNDPYFPPNRENRQLALWLGMTIFNDLCWNYNDSRPGAAGPLPDFRNSNEWAGTLLEALGTKAHLPEITLTPQRWRDTVVDRVLRVIEEWSR